MSHNVNDRVGGRELFGSPVAMVACGGDGTGSTAVVTDDGMLWLSGDGTSGFEKSSNDVDSVATPWLRLKKISIQQFGGSPVLMVACGYAHYVTVRARARLLANTWACVCVRACACALCSSCLLT